LNAYEQGRYADALQQYEELHTQNPDDRRLAYNLGAAAYQAGDFAKAADAFTNALTAPDLVLQQKGFYNLGNTLFRLGEQAPDDTQRAAQWRQAVQSYEGALKLNDQDLDAQNNLAFVQRKLEELPPPPPSPDQQQPEEEPERDNEQDEQNQSGKGQDQQSQQPDQQNPEPQSDPSQNREDQDQPETPADRQQPQPQPADQHDDPPSENQPQPQPADTSPGSTDSPTRPDQQPPSGDHQAPPTPFGRMTPEQAKQLLDAQKDYERTMIFLPHQTNTTPLRVLRDW
jgi:Ca-activated chloride channel family protein